jgi:hypothetical protein
MDGKIGIIWQGKPKNDRPVVFGRVMTSVPNVLHALEVAKVSPDAFDGMVSGVASSEYLPCTLFVKGPGFGPVFAVLKNEGLCSDYRMR